MLNETEECINLLCELLRFETVSDFGVTNGSYELCGQWLLQKCQNIGLMASILPESKPGKPVVIAEWVGSDPSMPCIFLNSHYDVVPIVEGKWTQPAFAGLRTDSKVYGRGAQDMKSVCVQYIIGLARLKSSGYTPLRSIRLSFVPDEEIGGVDGMGILLASSWFAERNIGIALDEVILHIYIYMLLLC
jgi:aminoacylase